MKNLLATETVDRCPCGGNATTLVSEFVFWSRLGLRRCDSCGLLIVSPRLTKDAMRHVFSEYYFDYSALEVWGERRRRVFGDVVRGLKARGVKSVFDVGAAFGHFVKFAEAQGFSASGSDLSDGAVRVARERLGVTLHAGGLAELNLPRGSYDAVVSLDTFYYVADPRAELEEIRHLLKPNGVLFLRLRNCHRSQPPLEHLWGFTPESITRVLEVADWKVEQVEPASYSATAFNSLLVLGVGFNRALRMVGAPVLTHSFNIIARPIGPDPHLRP